MDGAAPTPDGWLLDVTESADGRSVVLWVKESRSGRVRRTAVEYRPPFLVCGPKADLVDLRRTLAGQPSVAEARLSFGHPSIYDRRMRPLLVVTPVRHNVRRSLAREIDALGGYERFALYDVDLAVPQLYHLGHGLYPFAPVVGRGADLCVTEPAERVDYVTPPISVAELEVRIAGERRGRIPPPDGRVGSIRLGDVTLEGPEDDLFRALVGELARTDPDLLLTEGGDSFDLPWLYRRAGACGLSPEEFVLGREQAPFAPSRPARSFESYGRVLHRSASFPLPGRFHIDGENSFLYRDAAVPGLVDAARLSRLSLQTVVTAVTGDVFHRDGDGGRPLARRARPVEEEPARGVPPRGPPRRGRPGRGDLPSAGRCPRRGRRVRLREPLPAHHGQEQPLRGDAQLSMLSREPGPGSRPRLPLLHAARSG